MMKQIGNDMRVMVIGMDQSSATDLTALTIFKVLGADVFLIDDIEYSPPDQNTDWRRAMDRMFNGLPDQVSHTAGPKLISKRAARRLRGRARA